MKPLRILMGNNTLSLLAGSETWTYTMAVQFKNMGHEVTCFSPELGIISDKLSQEHNIKSYKEINFSEFKPFSFILEEDVKHEYDVIICNHHDITKYLREKFPKTPIITTIHGIIHEFEGQIAPEHPALDAGVNQFVSVSEEIQKKLKDEYNLESEVIMNGFDITKFKDLKPVSEGKPTQFLINTNYQTVDDPIVQVVREAAKHFGAKLAAIGMNFNQIVDVEKAIERADVVFGMGRSLVEGVAAGRLGICHGRWGTGGAINEGSIDEIKYHNFSGRNSDHLFTTEELIELIEKNYKPDILQWGKDYVAREQNVVFQAEKYIRIARELLDPRVSSPVGVAAEAKPFRLAKE